MKFKENDIRPKNLDEGKFLAMKADLKRLHLDSNNFINVSCPACESENFVSEFQKFKFSFQRCLKCQTVFMSPRATPEILSKFYSGSVLYEYWDKYIFPASREARMKHVFRPRVKKILQICKKWKISPDILIEVGAAGGMFCEEAIKSKGFGRVIGIEPGKVQAESCRCKGIEVIESTLEELKNFELKAEIVTSFETIEHVFSPLIFLQNCNKLLAENGLLVLTCPNYLGFDIATLGVKSDSLDAEHINMFNPESLQKLVEKIGFEVLELETPGQLDAEIVRGKVLKGELDISQQKFLKNILLDNWKSLGPQFQLFLQQNRLSSHMWLVARKIN